MTDDDVARYEASIAQAREFYIAQRQVAPTTKPLPAYYFVLNLTKAFLTLTTPDVTRNDKMYHGVVVKPSAAGSYRFEDALSHAHPDGVFPALARLTGAGNDRPVKNPHVIEGFLP